MAGQIFGIIHFECGLASEPLPASSLGLYQTSSLRFGFEYKTVNRKTVGRPMNQLNYSMSFTRGTLFLHESLTMLELQPRFNDWNKLRRHVVEGNLLQARTLRSLQDTCGEVISRVKLLTPEEREWILEASGREQAYLLWVAKCRRYPFIAEFAAEVLRERFLNLHYEISTDDYETFFNRKAEWHPELDKLTDLTRQKLRQILFKTMREAGLINADHTIIPVILSTDFVSLLCSHPSRNDTILFPVFDSDLHVT